MNATIRIFRLLQRNQPKDKYSNSVMSSFVTMFMSVCSLNGVILRHIQTQNVTLNDATLCHLQALNDITYCHSRAVNDVTSRHSRAPSDNTLRHSQALNDDRGGVVLSGGFQRVQQVTQIRDVAG